MSVRKASTRLSASNDLPTVAEETAPVEEVIRELATTEESAIPESEIEETEKDTDDYKESDEDEDDEDEDEDVFKTQYILPMYQQQEEEGGYYYGVRESEEPDSFYSGQPYYGEGDYDSAEGMGAYKGMMYEAEESEASGALQIVETEEQRLIREERERIIMSYKTLYSERQILRRRNAFLQKKLVEHYRKRKMDHVMKEDTKGLDQEAKYLKRLFCFDEVKKESDEKIEQLKELVQELKSDVVQLEEESAENLNKVVSRHTEVAATMTVTKTGRTLSDKVVEKLMKKMSEKIEAIGKINLEYIKVNNCIAEKKAHLSSLVSFGEGFHIIDYERLKSSSTGLMDKIKEDDDEMNKTRLKTTQNIQNLAHTRERAFAVEKEIARVTEELENVELCHTNTRERVAQLKSKRDFLRNENTHMKQENGLLTSNPLMCDFEQSLEETQLHRDRLMQVKASFLAKQTKSLEVKKKMKEIGNLMEGNLIENNRLLMKKKLSRGSTIGAYRKSITASKSFFFK